MDTAAADGVRRAVVRARGQLLDLQKPDGHWVARFEATHGCTALYVITMTFLGMEDKLRPDAGAFLRYFWSRLQPTGAWNAWHEGPDNLGVSIESYFACLLLGTPREDPRLVRAKARILELGGINAAPLFTKFNLAVLGQYPWEMLPTLAPETMLFPNWPISIYSFASYARQFFVPLSLLAGLRARRQAPASASLADLFVEGGPTPTHHGAKGMLGSLLIGLERGLKVLNDRPLPFVRKRAIAAAERWILDRIDADGNFSGIIQPMAYAAMAFSMLGHRNESPVIDGLVRTLEGLIWREDDRAEVQNCWSALFDTALCLQAAVDLGIPASEPRLRRARDWILERQVLDVRGDWSVRRPHLQPGGWAFEYSNPHYPDLDDTAVVVSALCSLGRAGLPSPPDRLRRAMDWLVGMQSANGAWAAFDPDVDHPAIQQLDWNDINGFIDPPSPDVTGRVLEAIAHFGLPTYRANVQRAIAYLKRSQTPAGTWSARWMINHVHGTSFALLGATRVGETPDGWLAPAVTFLRSVQNPDGGWGESPDSYVDDKQWGRGPSTASQTAWALKGLHAAGLGLDDPSVARGVGYLVRTQRQEGDWSEKHFTGVGFPGVFYMYYGMFGVNWPMMALGRIASAAGLTTSSDAAA